MTCSETEPFILVCCEAWWDATKKREQLGEALEDQIRAICNDFESEMEIPGLNCPPTENSLLIFFNCTCGNKMSYRELDDIPTDDVECSKCSRTFLKWVKG